MDLKNIVTDKMYAGSIHFLGFSKKKESNMKTTKKNLLDYRVNS